MSNGILWAELILVLIENERETTGAVGVGMAGRERVWFFFSLRSFYFEVNCPAVEIKMGLTGCLTVYICKLYDI